MPSRHRYVILAAVALVGALPMAAMARSFGTSSGHATFSGSVHGSDSLKGKDRCIITAGPVTNVTLYAGKYLHTTGGYADYDYPTMTITRLRSKASGHNVNLAKSKDYLISVDAPQGASHLGDWAAGNLGNERKAKHKGSGKITFTSGGRSGSINAEMSPIPQTQTHGKVHVKANWSCPRAAVEG